ncbi:MAG: DNA primase [Parcubacteria group bacterium]|nr:DNA primase [Parcubacteria group bacterium]
MSDTQTIKDRIDIVQLIQEYIPLKKSGVNWKGCCPFHQEKTPSFMVHPERQFYHCFGCSKGGDIFSFIQEMEGMDFPEALKLLADRAGVKVDTFRSEINKSQKNRILEINSKAAYFFHNFLLQMPAAQTARDYLLDRGLSQQFLEDWQVGYVPDQWDLLVKYLLKKGCGIDDIIQSGLAIKKDNANPSTGRGYYDRFRGRIMFPIWDVHDNVIGFTGRILVETEHSGGKYINTPQTLVFDKSRMLYGLNKAKMEIRNKDVTVLVEGQMDVIACHQVGMKNVVAASGTALTLEQVKLLKRYSNNIAMAFDDDDAGKKAAKRGIDMALEQGMDVKIIQIPEGNGKDADECIKKDKDIWFKAVEDAQEVMEWYFAINLVDINKNKPHEKQKVAEMLLVEIARLPYAIERDHWLKELSEKIIVEVNTLKEEMKRIVAQNKTRQSYQKRSDNTQQLPKPESLEQTDRFYRLLEDLWTLFLKFPKFLSEQILLLNSDYFIDTQFLSLYENTLELYNNNKGLGNQNSEFIQEKIGDKNEIVHVLILKADKDFVDFDEEKAEKEISVILLEIKREWTKRKRQRLTEELGKAQNEGDEGKVGELMKKLVEVG